MKRKNMKQLMPILLITLLSVLCTATLAFADKSRTFVAYFGTETSSPQRSITNFNANVSGYSGAGGTVTLNSSTSMSFATSYTGNPGVWSSGKRYPSSNTITVTPDATHQIKSVYYIRTGDLEDELKKRKISDWTNETPTDKIAACSFTIDSDKDKDRTWYIWVVFEARVVVGSYNVTGKRYPVDYPGNSDLTSSAYNCSLTGKVGTTSPASTDSISLTGVAVNTTPTYYVGNSDPTCQVDKYSDDNGATWSTGNLLPAGGPYTSLVTDPITSNLNFYVSFTKLQRTITAAIDTTGASACGAITPVTNTYVVGTNQEFIFFPNTGCAVDSVIVDNADVTTAAINAGNKYTFSNIQTNHTITVKFITVATTAGSQYCQVPPFLAGQTTLKHNVLLIFDNSGSMANYPYLNNSTKKPYTCNSSNKTTTAPANVACTIGNINNFYGYFDKSKMYTYNSTGKKFTVSTNAIEYKKPTATSCSKITNGTTLSGNALNYLCMQKFDVVKKILVGGKVDPAAGADRNAANGTTKYFLKTNEGFLVETEVTEPTGLVHSVFDKVRLGVMTFNGNNAGVATAGSGDDGGVVATDLGADLNTVVSSVEAVAREGYTPLAESFFEALRYFQAGDSAYNGTSYAAKDPIQYSCQKHFVIMLTDGEPTNDQNIPGETGANVTDSAYTTWYSGLAAADKPTTGLLPKLTYYAHNNDLRAATVGKNDIAGKQNINFYAIYAFGDGSGTAILTEAAKFGAYKDASPYNNKPDVGEYDKTYFEASDGDELKVSLQSVFDDIAKTTSSGTAAAVANNKGGERGSNILQALFYPDWPKDSTVKWLGELQAMWLYLSPTMNNTAIYEDDGDKKLNPLVDKRQSGSPFDTKALWRAGAELQKMESGDRKIYTLLDSSVVLTNAANEFLAAKAAALKVTGLLNAAGLTDTAAGTLIDYIRGTDNSVYRPRKVSFMDPTTNSLNTADPKEWKLGDIINSTPQVQSSESINGYDASYGDSSYSKFIGTNEYKARNMVYAGSNDGMLHAFKLGKVTGNTSNSSIIATMTGTDLGKEQWAFIPHNALPYLQNQAGTEYCHQNLVDGAPTVVDVSAFKGDCTESNYWNCEKKTTVGTTGSVDAAKTTWGTVLIGSMGLGGASRDVASSCNETLNHDSVSTNNMDCVKTPVTGNGLSSYFALDVTTPLSPKHMWEFSDYSITADADKGLGFTTPGAAVIKVNATVAGKPDKTKNGRWFAVFASGPTGAILGTKQFTGRSDQNLKIYIVDLNGGSTFTKCTGAAQTNCNYWVKDTGIKYAFANSISGTSIDLDRWNPQQEGFYSDDVLYVTYTKASLDSAGYPDPTVRTAANAGDVVTPWDKGGVLRLVTNHNPDPFTWFTSTLIDNTGPITSAVARLQDRSSISQIRNPAKGNLWVYFGEGRYFHAGDDLSPRRKFYGVSDPCYKQYLDTTSTYAQYTGDTYKQYSMATTAAQCGSVALSDLEDQTTSITIDSATKTLVSGKKGWYVQMHEATTGTTAAEKGAERVLTDIRAEVNGCIFYTSFTPNTDVCQPGGYTSIWAVKYDTGGVCTASSLVCKMPVQTSSGAITLVDCKDAFTDHGDSSGGRVTPPPRDPPKPGDPVPVTPPPVTDYLTGMGGKKNTQSFSPSLPKKKIMHIQER